MKAPFKLYLGTIDFRGERAFFVDLLIPTMTANKILPTVSSCGRFLHIRYKIPEGFARFDETKNVPDTAVAGYRETISKIEDAYADLNEIMSDPPQVIGPLPCAIDSQFRHRGIVLDIPTCPEVFDELSQNMRVGNGQAYQVQFQVRLTYTCTQRHKIREDRTAYIHPAVFTPPRRPGINFGANIPPPHNARRVHVNARPHRQNHRNQNNFDDMSVGSEGSHIGEIPVPNEVGSNGSVDNLRDNLMPNRRQLARVRNEQDDATNNRARGGVNIPDDDGSL